MNQQAQWWDSMTYEERRARLSSLEAWRLAERASLTTLRSIELKWREEGRFEGWQAQRNTERAILRRERLSAARAAFVGPEPERKVVRVRESWKGSPSPTLTMELLAEVAALRAEVAKLKQQEA